MALRRLLIAAWLMSVLPGGAVASSWGSTMRSTIELDLSSGGVRAAALTNGGFETGDLTGWTFTVFPDPLFEDINGGPSISSTFPNVAPIGMPAGAPWLPTEGAYFASLVLGAPRQLLSDVFSVSGGDVLSFDYFFDYGDSQPGFPDGALGRLVTAAGDPVTEFFAWNTSPANMLPTGAEVPWTTVTHAFAAAGDFRLEFRVVNPTDFDFPSVLGVDNVYVAPEPSALALLVLGGAGLVWRRSEPRP